MLGTCSVHRDQCRLLQFFFRKEFLGSASHLFVLIMSVPIVHTARRSHRMSDPVNNSEI